MSILFLFAALSAGLASGFLPSGAPCGLWPKATLATAVAVAVGFAIQQGNPALLPLLSRDPAILDRGEVWRIITALFVQDGGMAGFLFNLFWLLAIGVVAERRWGENRWLLVYLGGGIISVLLALVWQPVGAGNSIACLALAGGLTAYVTSRKLFILQIVVRMIGLSAGAMLVMTGDVHGLAFWVGVPFGLAFAKRDTLSATPQEQTVVGPAV